MTNNKVTGDDDFVFPGKGFFYQRPNVVLIPSLYGRQSNVQKGGCCFASAPHSHSLQVAVLLDTR